MNPGPASNTRPLATIVAIVGVGAVLWVLVALLQNYTAGPPVDQERIALRRKSLADVQAASAELLNTYAYQDKAKDIVRVPISRGLELVLREWQNPAEARSNLLARAEKAAIAPPKPPEKPSEFE